MTSWHLSTTDPETLALDFGFKLSASGQDFGFRVQVCSKGP